MQNLGGQTRCIVGDLQMVKRIMPQLLGLLKINKQACSTKSLVSRKAEEGGHCLISCTLPLFQNQKVTVVATEKAGRVGYHL